MSKHDENTPDDQKITEGWLVHVLTFTIVCAIALLAWLILQPSSPPTDTPLEQAVRLIASQEKPNLLKAERILVEALNNTDDAQKTAYALALAGLYTNESEFFKEDGSEQIEKYLLIARDSAPENIAIQLTLATHYAQFNEPDKAVNTLSSLPDSAARSRVTAMNHALANQPEKALQEVDEGMKRHGLDDRLLWDAAWYAYLAQDKAKLPSRLQRARQLADVQQPLKSALMHLFLNEEAQASRDLSIYYGQRLEDADLAIEPPLALGFSLLMKRLTGAGQVNCVDRLLNKKLTTPQQYSGSNPELIACMKKENEHELALWLNKIPLFQS